MLAFQPVFRTLTVMGLLAFLCGCKDDLGKFLDYRGLRFLSDEGKVIQFSGSYLYHKPLPCVRLKGKLNFVLPLQEVTEEELTKLGVVGRQTGPDRTVYEFEQGVVRFDRGKLNSFSFQGLPVPGVVSIAPTKEGPFLSLPAPEQEIRKLFGEPSSVTRGSRPFH